METSVAPTTAEAKSSKEPKDRSVSGVSHPKIHLMRAVNFTTSAAAHRIPVVCVVIRRYYLASRA